LDDSDFRGSPVMHYDQVPGVRYDGFSGKTHLYSDVFPNLVRAALGSTDTVASVGPSLWTHTIGLNNSPNTGSQSPSYSILNNSVDKIYQITGARLNDLSLTFAANAAVEANFTWVGNISTNVASVAVVESTQHLVPAWNCAASIAGASVAVVESGSLDIKRDTKSIFTLGQQGPYNNFQGPLSVTGKLAFVVEAGEPWYADALTRDQLQVILNFVDPVTAYSMTFTMSNVQLQKPEIDQSKTYISLSTDFIATADTTDVVTIGYSPLKFVATNGISSAY
jgi:hypothetical protein